MFTEHKHKLVKVSLHEALKVKLLPLTLTNILVRIVPLNSF